MNNETLFSFNENKLKRDLPPEVVEMVKEHYVQDGRLQSNRLYDPDSNILESLLKCNMFASWKALASKRQSPKPESVFGECINGVAKFDKHDYLAEFLYHVIQKSAEARNWAYRNNVCPATPIARPTVWSVRRLKTIQRLAYDLMSAFGGESLRQAPDWDGFLPARIDSDAQWNRVWKNLNLIHDTARWRALEAESQGEIVNESIDSSPGRWLAREMKIYFIKKWGRPFNQVCADITQAVLPEGSSVNLDDVEKL